MVDVAQQIGDEGIPQRLIFEFCLETDGIGRAHIDTVGNNVAAAVKVAIGQRRTGNSNLSPTKKSQ